MIARDKGPSVMLRVISGGQTGADQGALVAAQNAGISTGGWAPRGWLTEKGPCPDLFSYGLVEAPESDYPARTRRNVNDADALIWFGNPHSPGGKLTVRLAEDRGIPIHVVNDCDDLDTPANVAAWLRNIYGFPGQAGIVLLVAGNRESKAPGIQVRTETFLCEVFRLLKKEHP